MRTFVLLCAALAVLQTVTAMTGPEGHTTDESGGPDNKEDCENMEGGFWREDHQRCESEDMCNTMGGFWDANRCELEEGHHSSTAYPGHHSTTAYPGHHSTTAYSGHHSTTAYPGHHSTTAYPGHHSTTISYWEQRERECTMHGGKWHWDIHWCDYHSTTAHPGHHWTTPYPGHSTTAHPGHHSTTAYPNSYWEQRKHECDSSGGSWHWDGRKGWCYHHSTTAHPGHHWTTPYPGHTTTLSPYAEFLKDCEKEGGAVITNHNHSEGGRNVCIGVSQYICNNWIYGGSTDSKEYDIYGGCVYEPEPEPEPAYPHTTTEQYGNENSYWKQRKHECDSSGGVGIGMAIKDRATTIRRLPTQAHRGGATPIPPPVHRTQRTPQNTMATIA